MFATFKNRAMFAAKAALGLFSDRQLQQAGGLVANLLGGQGAPPVRGTSGFLQSYTTMPWVRGIIGKVSYSVAATSWKLLAVKGKRDPRARRDWAIQRGTRVERQKLLAIRQKEGELLELTEHPMLDLLNDANTFHTGLSLRKLTQIYLDLIGDVFWLKQRNQLGAPIAAWPIPPHWVARVPTAESPFYEMSSAGQRFIIPDTEMLWMSDPNPLNPYGRGAGHMGALGDELETDEYAAKFSKQVFFNRARPDLLVMPKEGSLEPTEVNRLEQNWTAATQGFWRAFRPFFIRRAVEVKVFEQDFQAIQMTELRKLARDTTLQTVGIPPEILGVLESSNRATIEAAEYLFNEYVVVPRLEFLRSYLQSRLIPEYDERLILEYDSPSKIDKRLQLDAAKAAPWALSINEWRELQGYSELENDSGKMHMLPMNLTPVEEIEEEVEELEQSGGTNDGIQDTTSEEEDISVENETAPRGLSALSKKELRILYTLTRKMQCK